MTEPNPFTSKEYSDAVHAEPLWRALRWIVACVLVGPVRAARFLPEGSQGRRNFEPGGRWNP